ncbi:DUF3299 domain-containing protein [Ruegeria arenilitoris]|uniref:DUF3299 domain-containing protein n=1 Tax=Ruegeria arenilitoris TaxID=1173585 RepID=UPI00147BD829|nr:DUF3299 domain-containing protein [Ruegeria arenilitoris]
MKTLFRLITMAALLLAGQASFAAPGVALDWSDLPDPSVQVFEDPYRDLSPEQFDDLLFVVRLRGRLAQDIGSAEERQKWQELLTETEEALAADDIDVDWLLDQRQEVTERRKKAGTAGNPEFDGQTITLAGFAIPAPPDPDGQPVAYLVPERGMCSHMPPPPPNQMIRVRLNGDWAPAYFHEPVRLTGLLTIDPTDLKMVVVDGLMPMRATFQLNADSVETLETRGDQLEWTQSVADRLRAAGNRKTGGPKVSE